jgi:hypothetical protein
MITGLKIPKLISWIFSVDILFGFMTLSNKKKQ